MPEMTVKTDARDERTISVLVVEDSPVIRDFLIHLLSGAGFRVIGTAHNGAEAVEFVQRNKPDVVTMDLYMPVMNGFEATRRIMETTPVPIVIVSGLWDPKEVESTFRALEAGALAIVQRPRSFDHPDHESTAEELIRKVRLMSEIKVVRRRRQTEKATSAPPAEPLDLPRFAGQRIDVVAIGASTGGPAVLQTILQAMPREYPAPLLIVQHMSPGFMPGLVGWLGQTSGLRLAMGSAGAPALPGHAYLAPDGCHMGIGSDGRIILADNEPEHGARPSVSFLFRSVARAYGGKAAAILLTGMGKDGAEEMKLLRDQGALTIAQNQESSVVYGMPAAAVELGGAAWVLAPEQMPALLAERMMRADRGDERDGR